MARLSHNILIIAVAFGACSGSKNETLNPEPVNGYLARMGNSVPAYKNYGDLVVMPRHMAGDERRLFVYHSDQKTPSIFQVTEASLPGLTEDHLALRFSAKSNGERVIAIYENGAFIRAGHLRPTDDLPVTRPEISDEDLPMLVLELFISDANADAVQQLNSLRLFESNYPEIVRDAPISAELDIFRNIKRSDPLFKRPPDVIDRSEPHKMKAQWTGNADKDLLLLANTGPYPRTFSMENAARLRLHPDLLRAEYSDARKSQITLDGVIVPARTIAIFVRRKDTP